MAEWVVNEAIRALVCHEYQSYDELLVNQIEFTMSWKGITDEDMDHRLMRNFRKLMNTGQYKKYLVQISVALGVGVALY